MYCFNTTAYCMLHNNLHDPFKFIQSCICFLLLFNNYINNVYISNSHNIRDKTKKKMVYLSSVITKSTQQYIIYHRYRLLPTIQKHGFVITHQQCIYKTHYYIRYSQFSSETQQVLIKHTTNNNESSNNQHTTQQQQQYELSIELPVNKTAYMIKYYTDNPHIRSYRHPRLLLSINYWKQFIQQFIKGSKLLVSNIFKARSIINKHRDELSGNINYNNITRAEQYFITTTKRDLKRGLPWLIWFALPIVGYTGIFVAHYLPQYLPGVYRSNNLLHHVRYDSQQYKNVIIFEIIELLHNKLINNNNKLNTIQINDIQYTIDKLCKCTNNDYYDIAIDDINRIAIILQDYISLNEFSRQHIHWLLIYLGDSNMLNSIYPYCYLIHKLNRIAIHIQNDDISIRKDNYADKLTNHELYTLLYERGLPFSQQLYKTEALKQCLNEWLELTHKYQIQDHNNHNNNNKHNDNNNSNNNNNNNNNQPIMLYTPCRWLSPQTYVYNKLLPISILHIGLLWNNRIQKTGQYNTEVVVHEKDENSTI